MSESAHLLADDLERLLDLPLAASTERDYWYAQAQAVERTLHECAPSLSVPHELWHYLADADIRARDPAYCHAQEQFVRDYLAELRATTPTA